MTDTLQLTMPPPLTTTPSATVLRRLQVLAGDIKLSHSVFALPWAVLATFMAARDAGRYLPHLGQLLLVLVCMVAGRSFAMAFNRLLDARLDRLNPRTAGRAIPAGALTPQFVTGFLCLTAALFVAATGGFGVFYSNWVPLWASVPVLVFVACYPLLKRFSFLCHYYLGLALGLAPVCAWVAIAGGLSPEPIIMAVVVLFWTAGFDIIYATQDVRSDRELGVFSLPARFGVSRALLIARLSHVLCVCGLLWLARVSPTLGPVFVGGTIIVTCLLIVEHAVVRPGNLSRVNLAFFTLNGIISLLLGVGGLVDVLLT